MPRNEHKTDKIPIDPRTLQMFPKGGDWQNDPTACVTFEDASKLVQLCGPEYGIGFLFTESDPFFFIDIDNCRVDGQWSQTATDILNRLPGSAVEISQSGNSLHVFGTYNGPAPEHSCKNIPLELELYTRGRFVALTGDQAAGNAATDCSVSLPSVISIYYPPKQYEAEVEWTEEPVPEWTGTDDDDELIEKMLSAKSAASTFKGSSGIQSLWEADEDALSAAYPDSGDRSYDSSSADAALAQHLAFWTGKNCERIMRIMKRSELVREKWEREDYLTRTILNAVSMQKEVYSVPKADGQEVNDSGLKGNTKQIGYAVAVRAQKLAECIDDQEGTELLLRQKSAGWWLDNKTRSAKELIDSLRPIDGAAKIFENIEGPEFLAGYQYLGAAQQADFFKGCVYIQENHRVFTPSGVLLKQDQFNATYGGYVYQLDDSNGKTTKKAFEAFTESQVVRYPKAEIMCFRPMLSPGELVKQDGRVLVNTYVPVNTKRIKGDPGPFLRHLSKVLPDTKDQTILLSFMAACVQYKGVKFQWAPLLQGVEGNGKTFFTRCVAAAIGEKYVHFPPASEIGEKFNAWLFDKLFIGVEDIYVPDQKREVFEILKTMITNNRLARRAMQTDQTMHDVCCNFIFNSNHQDSVRKTQNDRRFSVFYSAQQQASDLERDGMTGNYFPDLYDWLRREGYAIVTDFLYSYQIPDELNPAGACHRAPATSTTDEAIAASLGGVEQEIMEAVDEERPGFCGGWVSSMALDLLLKMKRKDSAVPINKRKAMLKTLGYEWHPALSQGRVNNSVMPDNGKPRLFVKSDSPYLNLKIASEVARVYSDAQLPGASKAAEVFKNG